MTKKLEEVFNLPPAQIEKIDDDASHEVEQYTREEIQEMIDKAQKIDNALPQVSGLDRIDSDYDQYAQKAIEAFEELVELGQNVEPRLIGEVYQAASSMMTNALNAKNSKANKKLEMVKLQIQNYKAETDRKKVEYLEKRHLGNQEEEESQETSGRILTTRNDVIQDVLKGMGGDTDSDDDA